MEPPQKKISNKQKKRKDIPPKLNLESFSEFKKSEKFYRAYKGGTTDFSQLLDVNNPGLNLEAHGITQLPVEGMRVYKLDFPAGVYIVKKFLTVREQLDITKKCLNEYHKKPYRTNLYIYEKKPLAENGEKVNIENSEESKTNNEMELEASSEKMSMSFMSSSVGDENSDEPYNLKKFLINDPEKYYFNKKIRWANVGYQYDWDNRMYPETKTFLPEHLEKLCEKTRIFVDEKLKENIGEYKPESTIINYYDSKNFMGGHLDDGEKDQKSPIFSYCFGLSCVFLMGGKTKEVKPHALKLDSGKNYNKRF